MPSLLDRIRNSPNLAGAILAVLAFIAVILISPMFQNTDRQTSLIVAAGIAALAFYKGRRAVQKRLGE